MESWKEYEICFPRKKEITINQEHGLLSLNSNIGMMGYENTERTGFMDPTILMVMKGRGKNNQPGSNQKNDGKGSDTGAT
ncbi:MAG: hypothetical protein ACUVT6_12770 [Thermodesulfobacteriota bacterium]